MSIRRVAGRGCRQTVPARSEMNLTRIWCLTALVSGTLLISLLSASRAVHVQTEPNPNFPFISSERFLSFAKQKLQHSLALNALAGEIAK